jgi:hypothetical protein
MNKQSSGHTFHIPVMGTGFTIDSPVKVAKYGISSVISLVDDTLMEQMRKFYAETYGEPYEPITKSDPDRRARRVTEYLNLLDRIVKKEFAKVRASAFEAGSEITKYFEMLPDHAVLKKLYNSMAAAADAHQKRRMQDELRAQMTPGRIDVNIMTKLDKPRLDASGQPAYDEFSEALANLRGFAQSSLESAIVFSAGLNQRLYTYTEQFKDFYADANGKIRKQVILKVSDFRSSLTQGKIFAKKGIMISEFRVESGLNCGGHAFSSGGVLLGPILHEFKNKRAELFTKLKEMYLKGLADKGRPAPAVVEPFKVTAQGGIGTAAEDQFLRDEYDLDGTGWGTPFLLCPEASSLDDATLNELLQTGESDLYLSDSSPLGVPFNNISKSSSEKDKRRRIAEGKPGAVCVKGSLATNNEFGVMLCPASREYQAKKLAELAAKGLSDAEYKKQFDYITTKACICHQLGNGVLIKKGIISPDQPVAVCPGPNLAFFSKVVTLKEMADHIYGRISIINSRPRINLFLKELELNIDHLRHYIDDLFPHPDAKQKKYAVSFCQNLFDGIDYYRDLFTHAMESAWIFGERALAQLDELAATIHEIMQQHDLTLAEA